MIVKYKGRLSLWRNREKRSMKQYELERGALTMPDHLKSVENCLHKSLDMCVRARVVVVLRQSKFNASIDQQTTSVRFQQTRTWRLWIITIADEDNAPKN